SSCVRLPCSYNAPPSSTPTGTKGGNIRANHIERMLKNPAYRGYYARNRRHNAKFHRYAHSTGEIVPGQNYDERGSDNEPEDWVVTERKISGDPLVDEETWEKVQKKLARQEAEKDKQKGRSRRNPEAFLSDLLFCGHCEQAMETGYDDRRRDPDKRRFYYC